MSASTLKRKLKSKTNLPQPLNIRLHRAISWLKCAEENKDNLPKDIQTNSKNENIITSNKENNPILDHSNKIDHNQNYNLETEERKINDFKDKEYFDSYPNFLKTEEFNEFEKIIVPEKYIREDEKEHIKWVKICYEFYIFFIFMKYIISMKINIIIF